MRDEWKYGEVGDVNGELLSGVLPVYREWFGKERVCHVLLVYKRKKFDFCMNEFVKFGKIDSKLRQVS